jgi:uncharacterized protein YkwD
MFKKLLCIALIISACGDKEEKKEEPAPAPAPAPQPEPEKPGNPFPFPLPFPLPPIPGMPPIPVPGGGGDPVPPSAGTIQELADAINSARKSRGLSEVKVELQLNCAAKRHADDIGVKKICGHTGSDGSSPWDRAKDCGTSADGEIVACGQGSPKAAVDAWTLSPGHAAIMYAPNQTVVGVGMLNNYWVAIFR